MGKVIGPPPGWKATPVKTKPPTIDFTSGGEDAAVFASVAGLSDLEAALTKMPQFVRDAAGLEMSNIASEIIRDAQENFVPEDTGALRESGGFDEYVKGSTASVTSIRMWFGGNQGKGMGETEQSLGHTMPSGLDRSISGIFHGRRASSAVKAEEFSRERGEENPGSGIRDPSKYALEQHENMEYHHPRGGGPKYLEIPFVLRIPEFYERIAAAAGVAVEAVAIGADYLPVTTSEYYDRRTEFKGVAIGLKQQK